MISLISKEFSVQQPEKPFHPSGIGLDPVTLILKLDLDMIIMQKLKFLCQGFHN